MTKKVRFEVFKRDKFICQYCGKHPPDITLEIDHIIPKSKKGTDSLENLITSCFDCNRGKSNRLLKDLPKSLETKYKELKEREIQYKEYRKLLNKIDRSIQKDIDYIDSIYIDSFSDWALSDSFKQVSVKRFIKDLGVNEVRDSMYLAISKINNKDESIRYFCGICWSKIRQKEEKNIG